MSFFVTKPAGSPLRPYVAAAAAIAVLVLAVINFTQTAGLASAYFEAVDKKNNNNARIALYSNGVAAVPGRPSSGRASPGTSPRPSSGATGWARRSRRRSTTTTSWSAAVGGALGLLLLLLWVAATEVNALRRYRGFLAAGETERPGCSACSW